MTVHFPATALRRLAEHDPAAAAELGYLPPAPSGPPPVVPADAPVASRVASLPPVEEPTSIPPEEKPEPATVPPEPEGRKASAPGKKPLAVPADLSAADRAVADAKSAIAEAHAAMLAGDAADEGDPFDALLTEQRRLHHAEERRLDLETLEEARDDDD